MAADFRQSLPFPKAAPGYVADERLRANLRHATATIRAKRNLRVGELPDFEELRLAAEAVKNDALARLDELLEQLERHVTAAGGHVHFARDAAEANEIVVDLVRRTGAGEVVKVKSMTTAEIRLNEALAEAGIDAAETDLAELIVQLGDDLPSHIVVPAIHRNRSEIREIFERRMGERGIGAPADLTDDPAALAGAARAHLRDRFLRAKVAISGANFAVAETGSLVVVESEGNGRMCLTLPETLISVVGIDKVVPSYADLEVFLQLLARSATGERMNPYTSIWTGATAGDGPSDVHLVLLDNGRSRALADPVGRQVLRCIRCAACLNVCPVYERVGGHAYGSVYPGPIGAVLTPQLDHVATDPVTAALPFASTLCGACFEVCPVRIDIPRLLVHLRAETVERGDGDGAGMERVAMAAAGYAMSSPRRFLAVERVAGRLGALLFRDGRVRTLPGPLAGWTSSRDAPLPATRPFREWWREEHRSDAPARGGKGTLGVVDVLRALVPRGRRAGRPGSRRDGAASRYGADGAGPAPVTPARSAVLGAVRAALGAAPMAHHEVERTYRRAGEITLERPLDVLVERLTDYRAEVVQVGPDGVAGAVDRALARRGDGAVLVPPGFPDRWLSDRGRPVLVREESPLSPAELDGVAATVSTCRVAIAETGTIVLDAGPGQGRRALSLVPDHLVVVVRAEQVVAGVPDAIALLDPTAPQTWISGPSATSDIELNRVEGVHGPRVLDVILVAEPDRASAPRTSAVEEPQPPSRSTT